MKPRVSTRSIQFHKRPMLQWKTWILLKTDSRKYSLITVELVTKFKHLAEIIQIVFRGAYKNIN